MASISVGITGLEGLERMRLLLSPKTLAKAQAGGISYAAKAVPPAVAKGISASYNIRSARVKEDILSTSFNTDRTEARIRFSRRPPTLTQFKPSQGRRSPQRGLGRGLGWAPPSRPGTPLKATVLRSKPRQPYTGAFLVTGNNGNQIVLRRQGARLVGVYGPSTGSIYLGNSAIGPELRATTEKRIQEQFLKGFERAMGAAARGFG